MKQVNINREVSINDFATEVQLKLSCDREIGSELCMILFLLKERLTGAINVQFKNFSIILKLSDDRYSHFESINLKEKIFKGRISIDTIDYILYYILKFYRDEIAEAEHIDVYFSDANKEKFVFTLSYEHFHEYSNDEIKKLLDL